MEGNKTTSMFNRVAASYDRFNRLSSFGCDRHWRRVAVKALKGCETVLDVACGSGDLAIALDKNGSRVTGVDLSPEMLAVAERKSTKVAFSQADGEALPFADEQFDGAVCGFGIRNYDHPERGIAEMIRVVRPGGVVVVLEFSLPSPPWRWLYRLYTRTLLPYIGYAVSHHDRSDYRYLPASIERFSNRYDVSDLMRRNGATMIKTRRMTFGVATLYVAEKNSARKSEQSITEKKC